MGCSASCPAKIATLRKEPTSNSSSSNGNLSSYNSFSDTSPNPVTRTLSLPIPLIHHPPVKKGDSNHFVSLTSTTYGSLHYRFNGGDLVNGPPQENSIHDSGTIEDSFSPDSVINTWELMEDLEKEEFDFPMVDTAKDLDKTEMNFYEMIKSYEIIEHPKSMPLWKHLSEESLLAKMEFNVVSIYHKALLGVKQVKNCPKPESLDCKNTSSCQFVGTNDQIVLYYTSLRGIRKTYEDCCTVRMILKGFQVFVDERDISLDQSYREELQERLQGKPISLPQLFINGKSIGCAEEIKQINETGELSYLFKGFAVKEAVFICETCGDVRFVPCPICHGSSKIYDDIEEQVKRCNDCNENGLIRCNVCQPKVY